MPFLTAQESASGGELPQGYQTPEEDRAAVQETALSGESDQVQGSGQDSREDSPEPASPVFYIHSLSFLTRCGIAIAIIALQVLLIWLVWHMLIPWIAEKIEKTVKNNIKPLTVKKIVILSTKKIVDAIDVLLKIFKYLLTAFQLFITVPIIFSLFPATKNLASTLFGYVLNPLRNIIVGAVGYIPNLITIFVIVTITRYAIKLLRYFSSQITKGRLVIPGFYADWAEPTFRILQVLLWAFTVALVYPYLPGSESRVFQGVSVFIGIILSVGSSSAIGNLIAGLVITYMRPFVIGDRVQIKEVTGFVVEKNLMVVRLKTDKNEYVTFPNLTILNSSVTNYHASSYEDTDGLIIHTQVTIGYETPWEKVHGLLIAAAAATDYIQKTPKPYVLQTGLDDFYARYQINCYTKEINRIPRIYAQLYENIQNGFRDAGIDMTSPHYEIIRQLKA